MRNNICTARSPRFQYNHLSKLCQVKLIYTTKIQSISLSSNRLGKTYAIGSLFDSLITSIKATQPRIPISQNRKQLLHHQPSAYETSTLQWSRSRSSKRTQIEQRGIKGIQGKKIIPCSVSSRDFWSQLFSFCEGLEEDF